MFPIFTTAWALAILFHLSTPQGSDRKPASVLLFVAALSAIAWPASSLSLLALCILQIVQFWRRLPRAQSSEYFKFICGLCLLSTYAGLSWSESALRIEPEVWFRSAVPLLRLAVSLLFFAAVLHKLNFDFLKVGVSFAPQFFHRFLDALGLPKLRFMQQTFPHVTILTEAFIAVGLLFPVTRLFAVVVLLLFFFVVGLQGIVQFSSLMYAAALLFLDDKRPWKSMAGSRVAGRASAPGVRLSVCPCFLGSLRAAPRVDAARAPGVPVVGVRRFRLGESRPRPGLSRRGASFHVSPLPGAGCPVAALFLE